MTRLDSFKKKANSFLYDHLWLKYTLDYGSAFFMSVLSAAIFAFGIVCFMKPGGDLNNIVSGGSSGLAQVIELVLSMCGVNSPEASPNLIFSLCYILINVPLIILAFKGIGKRFAIFTAVNVLSAFGFSNLFSIASIKPFFDQIAEFANANGGLLTRALFAGLCTGLSSAIAFKFETSAGGFDIVSYYISLRKSTATGPYIAIINGVIVLSFYLLTGIQGHLDGNALEVWAEAFAGALFSSVYLVATLLIVDLINVRNKKAQIQIVTEKQDLPQLLLANIPHGVTVTKGVGAYSGKEHLIVYTVISINEVKKTVKFIREIDPNSFINVTTLQQVYGRFYIRPVK